MGALRIFMVAGETSGDKLGAPLINALKQKSTTPIEFAGVGGQEMNAAGLRSIFDMEDIAVMGLLPVIKRLPTILDRLSKTAKAALAFKPDILVIIDSPDFTHRVAKNVKKALPNTKVVNYVCPSVWAWRSHRAANMASYVDHVLALLPFEPRVLKDLNGPPASYVGHPLIEHFSEQSSTRKKERKTLLVLPGSREGEVRRLLPAHKQVLDELWDIRQDVDVVIPAVEKRRKFIEDFVRDWPVQPEIIGSDKKYDAFRRADVALAASGTVLLELAVFKVPMISTYKLDPIARQLRHLMTNWTTALPNLVVGYPIIPEYIDEYFRPGTVARYLNRLMSDTPERQAQLAAFDELENKMRPQQKDTPSELAASIVLNL